jgi:hypothetical protein
VENTGSGNIDKVSSICSDDDYTSTPAACPEPPSPLLRPPSPNIFDRLAAGSGNGNDSDSNDEGNDETYNVLWPGVDADCHARLHPQDVVKLLNGAGAMLWQQASADACQLATCPSAQHERAT